MAEKKTAAQKAAEQAAAQQAPATEQPAEVKILSSKERKGLSQEAKASYLASVQTERAFIMNNTDSPSRHMIDGLTMIAQSTILDIAVNEIAIGGSALGHIITANENNYGVFQAMALERGVTLPDFKALPAPSKEDLEKAGLSGIGAQAKLLVVKPQDVSKETIEKKKKENDMVAKAVENPAEIKSKEQLKASLAALLIKPIGAKEGIDRPDARVQRTIKFYRGYLTIQAEQAEDKKAAHEKVKKMSRIDMLNEIAEIVGPCPFALSGTAYFLRKRTNETDSPISAFCLYRRSAVPEKGNPIDDQYVADLVRVLLIWSCNSQIAEHKSIIAANEKAIKKETGAAKTATETAIRVRKTQVEELQHIIEVTTNPSLDIVDSLIEDYNSEDAESEKYKLAHRIVDNVMTTYYPEFKDKSIDKDVMLKNVQQRAGIIVNMFRDPLAQSIAYKESNLTDMVEVEAPKEEPEEKKSEEKPKN